MRIKKTDPKAPTPSVAQANHFEVEADGGSIKEKTGVAHVVGTQNHHTLIRITVDRPFSARTRRAGLHF